jgi:O-antigen ligase
MPSLALSPDDPPRTRLELIGLLALVGFVAALQFSIAAAQILLTVVLLAWFGLMVTGRERFTAPRLFWPLLGYAAMTLVSSAFSLDPRASFIDDKQLLLFLIVPAVYRLARGRRTDMLLTVMITVGAISAAVGVVQYGVLNFNNLADRAHGTVGHYMTYSGLLMLVTCVALAKILFSRDRVWPALMLPALLVAVAFTFTRNAWVGIGAAAGLLLSLKDVKLLWLLPIVLAIGLGIAPARITNRFYSIFNMENPTNSDRIAMLQAGVHIVRDHPLTGVGPNMIERVYPSYREPYAAPGNRPHLHNVPMQIAAERGLPALAVWIWFIALTTLDLSRRFRLDRHKVAAAAGLAAVVAMLSAGMFEHNFGNSEFLMLFLTLITLPFAAARPAESSTAPAPEA